MSVTLVTVFDPKKIEVTRVFHLPKVKLEVPGTNTLELRGLYNTTL